MYHGDIRLGDTLDLKFCTVQSTGAPTTLAGSPVISAYPANSTTQLTAGITLSVDFDSVTGLNNVRVVASSGNGYLTATNYVLVITTGTVNSVSAVGYVIGSFSIENRSALMPTTAGRTAVVDAAGLIDANAVKVGPSGSGTAQTARDIGANVLLSPGTGTGQLTITSGVVAADVTKWDGTAVATPDTAGYPKTTVKTGTGTGEINLSSGAVPVKGNVKKNTALASFPFLMTDSTAHSPATGKTVTVTRSIDGGAFAGGTLSAVTEVANGIYVVDFGSGDLNGNNIILRATASGCDDVFERVITFVA